MRKLSQATATIIPFDRAARPRERRTLKSFAGSLTCLVLVRHAETAMALLVSDDNDPIGAVWVPKAMLSIDRADRGRFLVATMSQDFARQKRLSIPFINPDKLLPEEAAQLADANCTAARNRNRLRGHRKPMSWNGGRNVFA
ncbi:MAG: hypothetical protein J0H40_17945 [Rhizobiales bacterium]|nr:hypothetical protein [Hyphomicrobiales bacterium]